MSKNNRAKLYISKIIPIFIAVAVSGCALNSAVDSTDKNTAQLAKLQAQKELEKKREWYNRRWAIRQEYQKKWQKSRFQTEKLAKTQQVRPNATRKARHNPHRISGHQLSKAALGRLFHRVRYDGRYIPIRYPMGDVPRSIGVCTDTVIRSYRTVGVDLQSLVHEDMRRAFNAYPNLPKWGLIGPDPNIDHRRVKNLRVFFARKGASLPVTNDPRRYRPGDLVTWHLGGGQEHIGLVVNRKSPMDPNRYMIVHNIAHGNRLEDVLFQWPIIGHYRYHPVPRGNQYYASR